MNHIVLTMLLCDEPPAVLQRAIKSALPHVQRWCVSFNGSGAETPHTVERLLGHLRGTLYRQPWIDYGYNRTEALQLAALQLTAGQGDGYALVLDADEVIERWPATLPELAEDGYEVVECMGALEYPKLRLFKLGRPWVYHGAVHEYPALIGSSVGKLPIAIRNLRDGANGKTPPAERYKREAGSLQAALERDPNNTRAQFYLAQSLELAGEYGPAVSEYSKRLFNTAGFDEERFISAMRMAHIAERASLAANNEESALIASELCLTAHELRPLRAEPLESLARLARARGQHHAAFLYAQAACERAATVTGDRLFIDTACYRYRAKDELAMAAELTGRQEFAAAVRAELALSKAAAQAADQA